mmetsp:Transcript_5066/g.12087  ORF Transcript_5066/g.12087 Transcript_5066/m.12087 type:complete len:98 (+) Transcript_5066:1540-1833(+)
MVSSSLIMAKFLLTQPPICFLRADPNTNKETFSQEAVVAFQKYMNDDDDGPLSSFFDPGYLRTVKRELGIHYHYGQPDEETIQDALEVLRMYEQRHG